MRGAEGDLERALELGDRALELWVPGTRPLDLQAPPAPARRRDVLGRSVRTLGRAFEANAGARDATSTAPSRSCAAVGSRPWRSPGSGVTKRRSRSSTSSSRSRASSARTRTVVLNYSALAYRELHDLDEARSRSEEALSLSAADTFGMPRQFAGSDLLFTQDPRRRHRRSAGGLAVAAGRAPARRRAGRPG